MTTRLHPFQPRRAAAITVIAALAVLGLPRDWASSLGTAIATVCGTDTVLVYGPTKFTKTGPSTMWNYFDDTFSASPIAGRRYVVGSHNLSPPVFQNLSPPSPPVA